MGERIWEVSASAGFFIQCLDLRWREAHLSQPQAGVLFQIAGELAILALGLEQCRAVELREWLPFRDLRAHEVHMQLVDTPSM
jgi:hypothetical protein